MSRQQTRWEKSRRKLRGPDQRILADRGTESPANAERHESEPDLAGDDNEHARTNHEGPQTNGMCERFHRTRGFRPGHVQLDRLAKYEIQTEERRRPDNVEEASVVEREFSDIRLLSEDMSESDHSPTICKKTDRIMVVRKNLSVEKECLFDDIRCFFYATNDR